MARNFKQGFYTPKNPQKYEGDHTKIVYRSSWELKLFLWCDRTDYVHKWSSEETIIWYRSPIDGKQHRYFPDVKIKIKKGDELYTYLVEVKPLAQTKKPEPGNKQKRTFINEAMTYLVNEAKWNAAAEFCNKRGWRFKIITERELF
jgi:hypothetical protein